MSISIYLSLYIHILVAPCLKNLLRLEAGYPGHKLNKTQVTRTTHLMMLAASRTSTRHRHSYQHAITLAAPVAHPQHPMTLAASRMQYSHKTRATSPGPGPIVCV